MQLSRIGFGEPHDADHIVYELEDEDGAPVVSDDETFGNIFDRPAYRAALARMQGAREHPEFVEGGYILRIHCVPEQGAMPDTIPLG